MDRAQALAHLTSVCIPEASDEAALSKIWAATKEKLERPFGGGVAVDPDASARV
jgi:hypothetical protein